MMELQASESPSMTYDEVSMERSKNFVRALQELKNLRPQLYSAAEYCEKSYLNSEQKQMVLDNLKDYAVRALVNAVDHLGTVASKLTDLLDQQSSDVSTMELQVSCLNQQLLTCHTYMDKEGIRQQQLLAIIPSHHKHYILPNSVNKKVHFSPQRQASARQNPIQARSRLQPSDSPASKTLSWHLSSETKPTLKGTSNSITSTDDSKSSERASTAFRLMDSEEGTWIKSSGASFGAMQKFGSVQKDMLMDGSKPMTAFGSFGGANRRERTASPMRSKSVLSHFFAKQKNTKLKTSAVS